jgi:aldehyde dehydrogenase (NAD+)
MVTTYFNYIDGEWIASKSGHTFTQVNPADTGKVLGYFQDSSAEDAKDAISAAVKAFPEWKSTTVFARRDILYRVMTYMEKDKEALATIITKEVGKTISAARKEVDAAVNALKHFIGAVHQLSGETIPSHDPATFAYTLKEPLGAVGVITPFNFPLGIGIFKIAPALIAGNTVVYKPTNETAQVAVKLVERFEQAGIPKGVLNMVTGEGSVVGHEMAVNPALEAISFTGSTDVGLSLGKTVRNRGGKMQAEMGGKNATVILEDADFENAVKGAIISGMYNNGQSCTGTSLVIVPKNIAGTIKDMLVKEAKEISVADGFSEGADNGAIANERQLNKYLHYIKVAKEEGAIIEFGGERLMDQGRDKGYFVAPTVLSHVSTDMRVAQEEIFGPVIGIIEVDSYDEAVDIANNTDFGLSSSIYTKDLNKAHDFVARIETGVTHVNIPSNLFENQLPFGGKKKSSIGPREQGSRALDFWLETKAVYMKP